MVSTSKFLSLVLISLLSGLDDVCLGGCGLDDNISANGFRRRWNEVSERPRVTLSQPFKQSSAEVNEYRACVGRRYHAAPSSDSAARIGRR